MKHWSFHMVTAIGQDERFKKQCPHCEAQLQFQENDVKASSETAPGYRSDRKSLIVCSECHEVVDVTSPYGTSSAAKYQQQERDDL
jgi:hypothetical protein